MISVSIQIRPGVKPADVYRRLKMTMPEAIDDAVKTAAEVLAEFVRKEYRVAGSSGREAPAESTLAKRKLGKPEGASPAIPRYTSVRSLYRSGEIARNIVVRKLGRSGAYRVEVRQGVKSKGTGFSGESEDLATVAAMQETGYLVKYTLTKASLAYLRILYQSMLGERSDDVDKGGRVDAVVVRRIKARPLWKELVKRKRKEIISVFRQRLDTKLFTGTVSYVGRRK